MVPQREMVTHSGSVLRRISQATDVKTDFLPSPKSKGVPPQEVHTDGGAGGPCRQSAASHTWLCHPKSHADLGLLHSARLPGTARLHLPDSLGLGPELSAFHPEGARFRSGHSGPGDAAPTNHLPFSDSFQGAAPVRLLGAE